MIILKNSISYYMFFHPVLKPSQMPKIMYQSMLQINRIKLDILIYFIIYSIISL